MGILIVGGNGATGVNLVKQILKNGRQVKVIVRPSSKIPNTWNKNNQVSVIRRNINEISLEEMIEYVKDCHAVASCLGHNLSFKGIYGKPRKLVTEAVNLICDAVIKNAPEVPVKFVLMNTAGNQNRDLKEPITFKEKMIIGAIRLLLPPHTDNEEAADYLRKKVGKKNSSIRWVVVRPDSLINLEKVTEYTVHNSPTRSAIFNPGKTSRINVGDFMAKLIVSKDEWNKWEGEMPVIYNME